MTPGDRDHSTPHESLRMAFIAQLVRAVIPNWSGATTHKHYWRLCRVHRRHVDKFTSGAGAASQAFGEAYLTLLVLCIFAGAE